MAKIRSTFLKSIAIPLSLLALFSPAGYAKVVLIIEQPEVVAYSDQASDLTPARVKAGVYSVVEVTNSASGAVLLKIAVPLPANKRKLGYALDKNTVRLAPRYHLLVVLNDLPTTSEDLLDYQEIPRNKLEFTGKKSSSELLPMLLLDEVLYFEQEENFFWVNADSGTMVGNISPTRAALILAESKALKLDQAEKMRLLHKQLQPGDPYLWVVLANGLPDIVESLANNNIIWVYPAFSYEFSQGKVIAIN